MGPSRGPVGKPRDDEGGTGTRRPVPPVGGGPPSGRRQPPKPMAVKTWAASTPPTIGATTGTQA